MTHQVRNDPGRLAIREAGKSILDCGPGWHWVSPEKLPVTVPQSPRTVNDPGSSLAQSGPGLSGIARGRTRAAPRARIAASWQAAAPDP